MPFRIEIARDFQHDSISELCRNLLIDGWFDNNGSMLFKGRNTLKIFECNGIKLVAKRYRKTNPFNKIIYGTIRKSKAHRAYNHGIALRNNGIDSPQPIAYIDIYHRGRLSNSYFISLHSDYMPLEPILQKVKTEDASAKKDIYLPLAEFIYDIHNRGFYHKDLNISNILCKQNESKKWLFQLIDTNRMSIRKRLSTTSRMNNLKRFTTDHIISLSLLASYAQVAKMEIDEIVIRGLIARIFFRRKLKRKLALKQMLKSIV